MPGRSATVPATGPTPTAAGGVRNEGLRGSMDVELFERLLRKVVREELETILGKRPPEPEQIAVALDPAALPHPFLLSERELRFAEELLPEGERMILRTRVYAARAEKMGNKKYAARLRRKAELLEQQLRSVA